MAIPFPPDGPQVQAALQKVPTPQLQQYAAGRPPQPTGQVTPGPMGAAAMALNERGAMGAANQRQMAMQNDPSKSPTTFQQLQAREQAVAQKEQQLGVMGALIAKKAQDLQAREQGIAALPMPQNMFTAMDGGIVFSGGGNVEGYASRGLVGGFSPIKSPLEELGFKGKEEASTEEDYVDKAERNIRQRLSELESAEAGARLSPEEKAKRLQEAEKKYAEQYEKYKQGISTLDEEAAEAIRGKVPTFQERLGRGLARLPTDLKGVRLGGALAALGSGAAEVDAKYSEREREAAKYITESKRKQAAADLAEQRNQPELARKLVEASEADMAKAYDIRKGVITAQIGAEKDIGTFKQKEELGQAKLEAARTARDQKEAFDREKLRLTLELQYERLKALQEKAGKGTGEGKTDLQFLSRTAYATLKEANDKLPPAERKSDAQLQSEASRLAANTIYSARNESARANALRAAASNAKNVADALSKLKFQSIYIESSPEEKARMEREIRDMFPSTGGGGGVAALPLPNAPRGSTPPLPPGFIPNSR